MAAPTLTASGNVTNTGTATLTTPVLAGNSGNIGLQMILTKVSGTVDGTAKPQGTIDGTNWVDIPSQSAFDITDVATQSTIWWLRDTKCMQYRVLITGAGTMVATPTGSYLIDEE